LPIILGRNISQGIFVLYNNPATFHPDRIWNDEDFGVFEEQKQEKQQDD